MSAPKPPWVWDELSDELRAESWRRLAAWVDWLEHAYAPWIDLPACWPSHEGLRTELTIFYYWHGWLMRSAVNPMDGVRWHNELRNSASAWKVLATCQHDLSVNYPDKLEASRRARRDGFIATVLDRREG